MFSVKTARPLWARFLIESAYVVLCVVAVSAGIFAGWIHRSPVGQDIALDAIKRAIGGEAPNASDAFKQDTVNLLILGCDEDLSPGGKRVLLKQARSDMMLLARLDFNNKSVRALSIPRDTLCQLPGYSEQKINAYHALGAAKSSRARQRTQQRGRPVPAGGNRG